MKNEKMNDGIFGLGINSLTPTPPDITHEKEKCCKNCIRVDGLTVDEKVIYACCNRSCICHTTQPESPDKEFIIGDDGEREWLCSHGIGHAKGVHTCDGCCSKPELPKWEEIKEEAERLYFQQGITVDDWLNFVSTLYQQAYKEGKKEVEPGIQKFNELAAHWISEAWDDYYPKYNATAKFKDYLFVRLDKYNQIFTRNFDKEFIPIDKILPLPNWEKLAHIIFNADTEYDTQEILKNEFSKFYQQAYEKGYEAGRRKLHTTETVDGYCCACEYDVAVMERKISEACKEAVEEGKIEGRCEVIRAIPNYKEEKIEQKNGEHFELSVGLKELKQSLREKFKI